MVAEAAGDPSGEASDEPYCTPLRLVRKPL
jgi:hypothetical protein